MDTTKEADSATGLGRRDVKAIFADLEARLSLLEERDLSLSAENTHLKDEVKQLQYRVEILAQAVKDSSAK